MSRSGITPEQVFAVASDLRDRGQTVTVQAVRQALGAGSFTTIAQHLRAWRAHTEAPAPMALPPAIAAAATQALTAMWTAAGTLARQEIDAVRAQAATEKQAAQAAVEEALQEVARLEARVRETQVTLRDQACAIEQWRAQGAACEAAQAACRATITERDARITELKADLAQAHERHAQKAAECGRLLGVLAAQPPGPAPSSPHPAPTS
ncbi:DNA-binding protein [Acidiferrobacter sp.]|uniref:DNA-binding protein n=1 Tax=Acidiferrobacter sp. TaxID=1872107 RepID=UPI00261AC1B3|nr:DNA-binding protein [Acidiferrobacter sp.]